MTTDGHVEKVRQSPDMIPQNNAQLQEVLRGK
jgi:hypothetical protein